MYTNSLCWIDRFREVRFTMSDDKIIGFDDAKQSHVFSRKEEKVKSMRKAFKAARENGKPKNNTSRGKKKKR